MKLFAISLTAAMMAGYAAAGMDMRIDFPFVPVPVVFPRVSTQNLQVCLTNLWDGNEENADMISGRNSRVHSVEQPQIQ